MFKSSTTWSQILAGTRDSLNGLEALKQLTGTLRTTEFPEAGVYELPGCVLDILVIGIKRGLDCLPIGRVV